MAKLLKKAFKDKFNQEKEKGNELRKQVEKLQQELDNMHKEMNKKTNVFKDIVNSLLSFDQGFIDEFQHLTAEE